MTAPRNSNDRLALGSGTTGFRDSIAQDDNHDVALMRTDVRRETMTNDLGVWTADDCALVLIDYQKEMFEVIRSETSADLVEMQVRLLAKTAKAFGLPIVLTTVGVGAGFNGPTLPSILSELDGIEAIDRYSMNAFEDEAFS